MIVDDEGNIVHNRTLTTDEMIDEILKSSVSVAHVSEAVDESPEEETPATPPSPAHNFIKFVPDKPGRKDGRFIQKECCGSNGPRHKVGCTGKVPEKRPDPIESASYAAGAIPPLKFIEVKDLQRQGYVAATIAEKKNLDLDEVEEAISASSHSEYLENRA